MIRGITKTAINGGAFFNPSDIVDIPDSWENETDLKLIGNSPLSDSDTIEIPKRRRSTAYHGKGSLSKPFKPIRLVPNRGGKKLLSKKRRSTKKDIYGEGWFDDVTKFALEKVAPELTKICNDIAMRTGEKLLDIIRDPERLLSIAKSFVPSAVEKVKKLFKIRSKKDLKDFTEEVIEDVKPTVQDLGKKGLQYIGEEIEESVIPRITNPTLSKIIRQIVDPARKQGKIELKAALEEVKELYPRIYIQLLKKYGISA